MLKNVCKYCNEPGNDEIKKLHCSHYYHDYCLMKVLEEKKYYCECGEAILGGYLSAIGIRKKRIDVEPEKVKGSSDPVNVNSKHNSNQKI